ncbi:hypothetical protein QFC19_003893 [Naganishia cerealis]|uniref:Uncharacterized protein n=1 Tax=Naganishia cerealis TaxID=610337 RepID=A0ACC2VZI7_9TREE|nr:hypothetical protein QFC19_003893 [Naganishia cerealis]
MKQDSKAQPVEGDSSFRPHRDEDSATATITPSCDHPLSALPSLRKSALYTVCSIAVATEALSTSCLFTATKIVAEDENLTSGGNAVWIFSASAIAFAACIPLGGRLADVSPPHWWLVSGLLGMSAFALGNSFGESVARLLLARG